MNEKATKTDASGILVGDLVKIKIYDNVEDHISMDREDWPKPNVWLEVLDVIDDSGRELLKVDVGGLLSDYWHYLPSSVSSHISRSEKSSALTKREQFAMAAMQGLLAYNGQMSYEECAEEAKLHADSLIAELAK